MTHYQKNSSKKEKPWVSNLLNNCRIWMVADPSNDPEASVFDEL